MENLDKFMSAFLTWMQEQFYGKEVRMFVLSLVTVIAVLVFPQPGIFPLVHAWQSALYVVLTTVAFVGWGLFYLYLGEEHYRWHQNVNNEDNGYKMEWSVFGVFTILNAILFFGCGYTALASWYAIFTNSVYDMQKTGVFGLALLVSLMFSIAAVLTGIYLWNAPQLFKLNASIWREPN